jgi:hypothetical protein
LPDPKLKLVVSLDRERDGRRRQLWREAEHSPNGYHNRSSPRNGGY